MLKTRRLSRYEKLQKASDNQIMLMRGASGDHVAALQDLLVDLGYPMPNSTIPGGFDGIFGSETDMQIKKFQKKAGLKADGIVGRMTLTALENLIEQNSDLETPCPIQHSAHLAHERTAQKSHRHSFAE